MLENLRDKLYSVQQELSAGLKILKAGEVSLTRSKSQLFKKKHFSCNFNAGADLLLHYQKQWEELHNNNEENAKKAEEVNQLIENLHQNCQHEGTTMQQLNVQLTQVPRLQTSVLTLMNKIGELEGLFEEVESALLSLEDVIETQQLQEQQLDQRFQLALHKEKRLAGYEETKMKLSEEHAIKVMEYEEKMQNTLKERQEIFKSAFEEQMQLYKTEGTIERTLSNPIATDLEEIQLDDDEEEIEKLDAFLQDLKCSSEEVAEQTDQTSDSDSTNKQDED